MSPVLNSICSSAVTHFCFFAICSTALPAPVEASSGEVRPGSSAVLVEGHELRVGLTSLSTVRKGIFGSYEHDGHIVYFETRRGPRTPRLLRKSDPKTSSHEIDVRFINSDGQPFLIQIGGHAPIDETWAEGTAEFRGASRAKTDFTLAAQAIGALAKVTFTRAFDHEYRALLDLASLVASAQVVEKIGDGPDPAISSPKLLSNNTYRHKVEIHDKSCCLGLGRHSATIGKYVSASGVTTTAVITCNHGTCAHGMPQKCSWTSPGNRSNHVHNHISCSTPYNPTSVFLHNSNDDTDLQYKALRENFHPSSTDGTCNNSSRNDYPTNCY